MKITQGFTLIEISLVLIITGILIGSVVIPTVNQYQDQRRIQITKQHLKKIKVALLNFITLHGYLPCPALDLDDSDPNFGKAASQVNGVCEDYEDSDGYLPWLDLNVSRYDGWGNQFRYRVDGWFNNSDGILDPLKDSDTTNDDKLIGSTKKDLIVTDYTGKDLNKNDPTSEYNSNIVAIVFSCGKNGRPDRDNDADGVVNSDADCSNDGTIDQTEDDFTQVNYFTDDFDDILIFLPKSIVLNRLTIAGRWSPE